jgi:hypothetical protein
VIIDTSIFISDALSPGRTGAASQVLVALPTLATIVLCEDIRDELMEKLVEKFHWTERRVLESYGPVIDAAVWVTPVEEQPWHRKVVKGDPDDTMLPRTAEAVYVQKISLIDAGQDRFIVSANPKHLVPGAAYSGFLFVTAHDLLLRMPDWS